MQYDSDDYDLDRNWWSPMQVPSFRRLIGLDPPLTPAERAKLGSLEALAAWGEPDLWCPGGTFSRPTPSIHGHATIIQKAWRRYAQQRRTCSATWPCPHRLSC